MHGLGLKAGAVASSVAHDAHNIVVAGTNDEDMALAVREIERMQGGLAVTRDGAVVERLPLPLGGWSRRWLPPRLRRRRIASSGRSRSRA